MCLLEYIYIVCYSVWNQREPFICADLLVKNSEIHIDMYFKW
jgi:hypothetical protein